MDRFDCVVVGAGVIGLAVARALALTGREVVILEAGDAVGCETSSRNSEVIHAGLYYPEKSLKARFCVYGRELLYAYCDRRGIPHRRCGKLVIATSPQQVDRLEMLHRQAKRNGVYDTKILDKGEIAAREPALRCLAGLWSPSTGIVDCHALMMALLGDFEAAGGVLVQRSRVRGGVARDGSLVLRVQDGKEQYEFAADLVVNCAGLGGDRLAASIDGIDRATLPVYRYAKGNYFSYTGKPQFASLIYPLPDEHGLGVHVTLDLAGKMRFGPDVEWVDDIDYAVDSHRVDAFYDAIRRYWPEVEADRLTPDYAGIRPKINGEASAAADFRVQTASVHGVPGLINLFGIESPGLTSSLALAEYVCDLSGGSSARR